MPKTAWKSFMAKGFVTIEFAHKISALDKQSAELRTRTACGKGIVKFLDKTFQGLENITISEIMENGL